MNNILFINTSLDKQLVLIFFTKKKNVKIVKKVKLPQTENLLKNIEKIFNKAKIVLQKIEGIAVVSGPGTFSSLRVAVTLANTLGWGLQIPVVDLRVNEIKKENLFKLIKKKIKNKKFKPVLPFYDKEPNITKPNPQL